MIQTIITIQHDGLHGATGALLQAIEHLQSLLPKEVVAQTLPPLPVEDRIVRPTQTDPLGGPEPDLDPARIFGAQPGTAGGPPLPPEQLAIVPPPPVAALTGDLVPPPPRPVVAAVPAPRPVGELDVSGRGWDERIHSSTRAKNKDGTWRGKRNLDPAVLAAVQAEQGQPPVGVATPQAASVPKPPPPMIPAIGAMTFADVIKKIQTEISAGKLAQATVTEEVRKLGLTALPDLAKRPDLFGAFLANLGIA